MTAILTKDQIELLTYTQSKAALKLLEKTYPIDKPITDIGKQYWDQCDDIANTLLWLEDRIREFEDPRMSTLDPKATVIEVKPKPVKKPQRKFSMNGVVYESVREAAKKAGIKETTLRNYVNRKPEVYFWVD